MTDAPEKIWVQPTERVPLPVKNGKKGAWLRGRWKDHDSNCHGDVLYIRADIHEARIKELEAEVREAKMSALEAVLRIAEELERQNGPLSKKGFPEDYRRGLEAGGNTMASAIRILIDKEVGE